MRSFVCACTLLFTINSQCSFPLHTLIADAIETCSGSSRLMKFLNRLDVCTSADKHTRYMTLSMPPLKRMKTLILSLYVMHPCKGGGSLSSLVQLSTSINFSPVPRLLPPHAIIPRGFRFRAGQRSYVAYGGNNCTYDL